jgi:hypothetical protein
MPNCLICKEPTRLMLNAEGKAVNYFNFKGSTISWCVDCIKIMIADQVGIILNDKAEPNLKNAVKVLHEGIAKGKKEGRIKFTGAQSAELSI